MKKVLQSGLHVFNFICVKYRSANRPSPSDPPSKGGKHWANMRPGSPRGQCRCPSHLRRLVFSSPCPLEKHKSVKKQSPLMIRSIGKRPQPGLRPQSSSLVPIDEFLRGTTEYAPPNFEVQSIGCLSILTKPTPAKETYRVDGKMGSAASPRLRSPKASHSM